MRARQSTILGTHTKTNTTRTTTTACAPSPDSSSSSWINLVRLFTMRIVLKNRQVPRPSQRKTIFVLAIDSENRQFEILHFTFETKTASLADLRSAIVQSKFFHGKGKEVLVQTIKGKIRQGDKLINHGCRNGDLLLALPVHHGGLPNDELLWKSVRSILTNPKIAWEFEARGVNTNEWLKLVK